MAEYWFVADGYNDKVQSFLADNGDSEVDLMFTVPEKDFNTAGKGSSEVKNLLKRLGVDSDILRRIAVASYEAEINVAAHSRGGVMHSAVYDDLIHIRFEDEGPGIGDIEQAMIPGFSTADELVRELGFGAGLGLPNIKKNSDALHIVSDAGSSTLVEFIIFFS
ncbi:MAG: ATP-binding protein [Candidatus Cloacimonetes bacterium]|jgi:anti-sigma regulatory factor (Ser/Thr protein kinase)|nr:ATP-binding protein [Candidatus Cloacimonadota bacterium]MDY0298427.1 ATP-binding protein [Candidatus Cloacimonadaceae bacterium]MCB5279041.1 ATP-binding protein [Candidatus Cloacimonadota bacterium]MCK9333450.1 ATP-binding protein [Candidatus Cloacimonadota bacterium]MDD2210165.1 ATP-binding protein [Candidatus Cloacimonadota bacterium]